MGQVVHRSATTTEVIRRAIQRSEESLRALAKRHGVNQKTVRKVEGAQFSCGTASPFWRHLIEPQLASTR